jgi:hypothetical protein
MVTRGRLRRPAARVLASLRAAPLLEGLSVTPYIKDGNRPKIGYSLRCTGLAAPRRAESGKAA